MENITPEPFKLYNEIQNYSWGGRNENAFIPKLMNSKIENDLPYAELWIGAHPKSPSKIMINGLFQSLDVMISKFPREILGEPVRKKFGDKLPFLLKVLSADRTLSIQMHPDKKQAEELHAEDSENYPDDNHKPEIAIAIDYLDAIVGLKPLNEIQETLRTYSQFEEFYGSDFYRKILDNNSPEEEEKKIKWFYTTTMDLGGNKRKLEKLLEELEHSLAGRAQLSKSESYFLENKKVFPSDIGLLSFFFFNLVSLEENRGFFLGAGVPHAYLRGNIIECMANSDNVIRAGLTTKYKDVKTLLELLDYSAGKPHVLNSDPQSYIYKTPAEEFEISRISLQENEKIGINSGKKVEIILVLKGEILLVPDGLGKSFSFIQGEAALMPALVENYHIISSCNSIFFRVTVPV